MYAGIRVSALNEDAPVTNLATSLKTMVSELHLISDDGMLMAILETTDMADGTRSDVMMGLGAFCRRRYAQTRLTSISLRGATVDVDRE